MESVKFYKYTAAGNDFVLFDKKEIGDFNLSSNEIIRICDRHFGIGADGVLVVSSSENNDFDLKFFNPDGSSGMLCANGSRCAIHYAGKKKYFNGSDAFFTVNEKKYSGAVIDEENVRLNLDDLDVFVKSISVEDEEVSINGFFIDTGAPHFLIDVSELKLKNVDGVNVNVLGKKFSEAEFFKPDGTNVNFIEVSDGLVKMRTYEKGVNAETLACGTGAIAAGILASSVYGLAPPITVEMPGGKSVVDFNSVEDSVSLTGKVKMIFEGKYFK
jgi:diaminopimelate epimerase